MLYPHTTQPPQAVPRPPPPAAPARPAGPWLVDVAALRRQFPIEEVVARYGVRLRPSGRTLVGLCPFHDDSDPSLYVYPHTASFFCFACRIGGDNVEWVQQYEDVGFRAAVARLTTAPPTLPAHLARRRPGGAARARAASVVPRTAERDPAELLCVETALEVYESRLLAHGRGMAYLTARGIDLDTARLCRLGYATGSGLAAALRARGLPLDAAERAGLMRNGSETLAGRVIVPEIRRGKPVWMVGRAVGNRRPKYLGLSGNKPLMGWEAALAAAKRGARIAVVEGPFDRLTLVAWGLPAVDLVGTYARPEVVHQLAHLSRVARRSGHRVRGADDGGLFLSFDADEPGVIACFELQDQLEALGDGAASVWMPRAGDRLPNDVGDLATLPGGRDLYLGALDRAAQRLAAQRRPCGTRTEQPKKEHHS